MSCKNKDLEKATGICWSAQTGARYLHGATITGVIWSNSSIDLKADFTCWLGQTAHQAKFTRLGSGFTEFETLHTWHKLCTFTLGLRYEHNLSGPWSAGALVEHTPDYFRDDDATLFMGTANYRPDFNQRLKFTGGAGVEFKDIEGDDVIFRTGVAYDVFLEGPLTLAPNIAFNFGENEESVTLGATLLFNF